MVDEHGVLTLEAIMLYTEDKLTAEDRKKVDEHAAEDEMSQDALEGFALSTNPSKTRFHVSSLAKEIQTRSGAVPIATKDYSESNFDWRKIAAGVALLLTAGTSIYLATEYFTSEQLADGVTHEAAEADKKSGGADQRNELREIIPVATDSIPVQEEEVVEAEFASEVADEAPTGETSAGSGLLEDSERAKEQQRLAKEQQLERLKDELAAKKKEQNSTQKNAVETSATLAAAQDNDQGIVETEPGLDMLAGNAAPALEQKMEEDAEEVTADMDIAANDKTDKKSDSYRQESAKRESESTARMAAEQQAAPVNEQAKYPGGDLKMYRFIEKKKNYTPAMKAQQLQGNVVVSFDIEADGRVTNAKVKSGVDGLLDEDALRVVRSMPKWKPATQNGSATKSSRTVVVQYSIGDE